MRHALEGILVRVYSYGYGRCSSDFFIELNLQLLDIIASIINVRQKDSEILSIYFRSNVSCIESIYDGVKNVLGVGLRKI